MTNEPRGILDNLTKYKQIQQKLSWIPDIVRDQKSITHPLLTILQEHKPWQQRYLASLESELQVLNGTPNLSQVTGRMENGDQFFDELSSVKLGASYKKKGFSVEFIPEAKKEKRPDFQIKKDGKVCVFEVKHISGETTLDVLFDDVRKVLSPYVVEIRTEKFQLASQARHLASIIIAELTRLEKESVRPGYSDPYVLSKEYARAKIWTNPKGITKETALFMAWSSEEDFKDTARRLTDILNNAREQLLAYLPEAVNVIALDVDKASLQEDEVEDVLRSTPGLFKTDEYRNISGVKFVSHVDPPVDTLYANSNNQHVNDGLLQTLGLSSSLEVITWWSGPISSLPISDQKRKAIFAELHEEFASRAVGRKVLRVIPPENDSTQAPEDDFRKIGINEIEDRVWFVDLPPGSGAYSTHGIGAGYGQGMAEAENRAVIGKLIEAFSSIPGLSYKETLSPEALDAGVKMLANNGLKPTVVLTNVDDFLNLGHFPGFVKPTATVPLLRTKSGYEIPVLESTEIPDDTAFLIDSGAVGALVLKQDVTVAISEIAEEETPEILRAIPDLKAEQLKERVRVRVEEVFRVDIDEPRAILRMHRESGPKLDNLSKG